MICTRVMRERSHSKICEVYFKYEDISLRKRLYTQIMDSTPIPLGATPAIFLLVFRNFCRKSSTRSPVTRAILLLTIIINSPRDIHLERFPEKFPRGTLLRWTTLSSTPFDLSDFIDFIGLHYRYYVCDGVFRTRESWRKDFASGKEHSSGLLPPPSHVSSAIVEQWWILI